MSQTTLPWYAVVLAGGSGTRFWPASRRTRPKQLLPLGPAAPQSLLRATIDRLSGLVPPNHVRLATGVHLVEASRRELSELPAEAFLAEPLAKNTAPCIAWAAALLADEDPEALVVVLPSDQHAVDAPEFRATLTRALDVASRGFITTVGIVPTRPETGYGYIELGAEDGQGARAVARFVEKPDAATAREYVSSGRYLWNAGIFVFRARDMLSAFAQFLPEMYRGALELVAAKKQGLAVYDQAVREFFASVQSISIDYGIMEKAANLRVVPGDFGWSDLGSWESAWELSAKDENGNAAGASTILVDARDNLVEDLSHGGAKKVIALVGVNDLCVVETDDALLILPRSRSQDVRAVVDELKKRGQDEKL
ncbi:MAG TPA: mannose-1-phosphate guanylyltransferase [Polyangiaceae bacterium]|nr:mannose-1-phosphate guanylyltransferase [Polyangiaceae bacterium]